MASIKPYKIAIPDATLDKLKLKLSITDFPEELENVGTSYGAPL
jgi:hypothetical protein